MRAILEESIMHIHTNPAVSSGAHLQSAAAAEKAASAQKAAETRRKLLEHASGQVGFANFLAPSFEAVSAPQPHRDPSQQSWSARPSLLEHEVENHPVSFWA